jgi:hypothetical protein
MGWVKLILMVMKISLVVTLNTNQVSHRALTLARLSMLNSVLSLLTG